MKKRTLLILSSAMFATSLASCGGKTEAHTHSYNTDKPEWVWTQVGEGYSAKALLTCSGCDEKTEGHTKLVDAEVGYERIASTCIFAGSETYTATAKEGGKTLTDTKTITLPLADHNYSQVSLTGTYKKEYKAFESFDVANLVVEGVCSVCTEKKTIPSTEYYVVYNEFGATSFRAGDTSVGISVSGEIYEITGLTVTKATVEKPVVTKTEYTYTGKEITFEIPTSDLYVITGNVATDVGSYKAKVALKDKINYEWSTGTSDDLEFDFVIKNATPEIKNFKDSYTTTCATAPDLSEVTATIGEVTFAYYSDAECTNEVGVDDLEPGTYYIKATVSGSGIETVSKVSTLTVIHKVEHHDVKAATMFDGGNVEYWGCGCGVLYLDEAQTQPATKEEVFLDPIGTEYLANPSKDGIISEEKSGLEKVFTRVYEKETSANFFLGDVYIADFDRVAFQIKAGVWFIFHDWDEGHSFDPNMWHNFELVKNADGSWNIYAGKVNEELTLRFSDVEGSSLKTVIQLTSEATTVYMTTMKVVEATKEVVIDSSLSDTQVAEDQIAPLGYEKVSHRKIGNDVSDLSIDPYPQGQPFLAKADIYLYERLDFAFKTLNRSLYDNHWSDPSCCAMDTWHYVTIERQQDGTYVSKVFTVEGVLKIEYKGVETFNKVLLYYNSAPTLEAMDWYTTEVKGVLRGDLPTPTGVIVDNCLFSANGVITKDTTEKAPLGFEKIKAYGGKEDYCHPQFYSAKDITLYSEVHFAYKTSGYFLFNGWGSLDSSHDWLYFNIANNGNGTCNLSVTTLSGKEVYSLNNMALTKTGLGTVYTANSLNALLGGVPSTGYYSSHMDGVDFVSYVTEVRGTLISE